MRIPEIRSALAEIRADAEEMAELLKATTKRMQQLEVELIRRPAKKRAPVTSTPMTPALKAGIIAYSKANPKASQREVAAHFNINPGRVSEALYGKRT